MNLQLRAGATDGLRGTRISTPRTVCDGRSVRRSWKNGMNVGADINLAMGQWEEAERIPPWWPLKFGERKVEASIIYGGMTRARVIPGCGLRELYPCGRGRFSLEEFRNWIQAGSAVGAASGRQVRGIT